VFAAAVVDVATSGGTALGGSLVAMLGVAGIGATALEGAPQLAKAVSNKQRNVWFMFSR